MIELQKNSLHTMWICRRPSRAFPSASNWKSTAKRNLHRVSITRWTALATAPTPDRDTGIQIACRVSVIAFMNKHRAEHGYTGVRPASPTSWASLEATMPTLSLNSPSLRRGLYFNILTDFNMILYCVVQKWCMKRYLSVTRWYSTILHTHNAWPFAKSSPATSSGYKRRS